MPHFAVRYTREPDDTLPWRKLPQSDRHSAVLCAANEDDARKLASRYVREMARHLRVRSLFVRDVVVVGDA